MRMGVEDSNASMLCQVDFEVFGHVQGEHSLRDCTFCSICNEIWSSLPFSCKKKNQKFQQIRLSNLVNLESLCGEMRELKIGPIHIN